MTLGEKYQYVDYVMKYGKSISKLNILIYLQSEHV
jgi:hypothetical protein